MSFTGRRWLEDSTYRCMGAVKDFFMLRFFRHLQNFFVSIVFKSKVPLYTVMEQFTRHLCLNTKEATHYRVLLTSRIDGLTPHQRCCTRWYLCTRY